MLSEKPANNFSQYGKVISPATVKKNAAVPFKDHPQFASVVDNLSRKYIHHIFLHVDMPKQLYGALIEAFILHLATVNTPYFLRNAECVYLDIGDREYYFEDAFQALKNILDSSEKYLLIALPNAELLSHHQMQSVIAHPKCRLLVFVTHSTHLPKPFDEFANLSITPPSPSDITAILKHQRIELENFHHVIIPDELLTLCYTQAKHYLSADPSLEKALLLLDSAAARIGIVDQPDSLPSLKPILTQVTLLEVLSEWTGIPASHLQPNQFNFHDFCQTMQQKIFGQENAVTLLGHALQQSQAHLREQTGPYCSVLFAGPRDSGKKSTALAYVEYRFNQPNMLFHAQILPSVTSIWEMKFQNYLSKQLFNLTQLIKTLPYAVIYFENAEALSATLMEQILEILSTGYARDSLDSLYCFQHTSFIFSTTLGSKRLTELAKSSEPSEDLQTINLMQLVSNHALPAHSPLYLPQEIVDEIVPELDTHLRNLFEQTQVIPFFPLNRLAIENIIRIKLKTLGKQLLSQHGIELGYAPEVIRFLANEAMKSAAIELEKSLKQLYVPIEQSLFNHDKNRSNQLFLQLNETGQVLRCEWVVG